MQTNSGGTLPATSEKRLGSLPTQGRLTAKQRKFVTHVAQGKRLIAAYRASYNTHASDKVVSVSANELMKNPKIISALNTLATNKRARANQADKEFNAKWFLIEQLIETCRNCQDDALRLRALELLAASMGISVSAAQAETA